MAAEAVIINADDFGLWPSVSAGILEAWSHKAIGDSSVFANAPNLADLLHAAEAAGMPVGVHLNLTHGSPLSDPTEIPALVSAHGQFMKRQQWTAALPVEQVRLELRRQVQRVTDLGWHPSHLDSHHHVHLYPEVFTVVVELAKELHVPVRAVNDGMYARLRDAGIPTPDHFSMAFYGERASVTMLIELVETCPSGTLEIMTHPGHSSSDLPSSYRDEREVELLALMSAHWQTFLQERGIPIIGFGALASP